MKLFAPILVLVTVLPAQVLELAALPAEGPAPEGRIDGTIAYDAAAREVILFGGQGNSTLNDLWAYSADRKQWRKIEAAGAPPPRFGHTLIYDAMRRRVVVFGGQASGFFNDTWAFDLAAGRWQQLNSGSGAPSKRYGHSAVYDAARDRMVISHGFTDAGRFDDTWAFDLSANTWRDISPQDRPLRRCLHHAALDPAGAQMYLYGGCASGTPVPNNCPLGDLWSFDLRTHRWREITATAPPPRQWYGMAFDEARRRLVIFGGSGRGRRSDVWDYDPAVGSWSELRLAGVEPVPRERHEAAYAGDLGGVLFFGGNAGARASNELLRLGPPQAAPPEPPPASRAPRINDGGVVPVFGNRPGPLAPGMIVSLYGERLGPETGVTAVFDPVTGKLPVSLGGAGLTFDGIAAPLYFAQTGQLNAQVPYELAGLDSAEVRLTYSGATGEPYRVTLAATAPDVFGAAFLPDGTRNSEQNRVAAGEFLIFFVNGAGVTIPSSATGAMAVAPLPGPAAPIRLTIGGMDAEIVFSGSAPGTAGLTQINARVPAGISPENRTIAVLLVDGKRSAEVPVYLR